IRPRSRLGARPPRRDSPSRLRPGSGLSLRRILDHSAAEQQQELHVDRVAAIAVLGNGLGNALERYPEHDDVLVLRPAAVADPAQPGGFDQREALAEHPGGGPELAEILPMGGTIAGLFLELADRAFDRTLAGLFVADQPRGQLQAELAERHAVLLDQDDLARVDRQDHGGAHVARAAVIYPASAAPGLDEAAGPFDLFGGVGVGGKGAVSHPARHSSISRSGNSFVSSSARGKCCASTFPTSVTAAIMPSARRPSRISDSIATIASPQVSGGTLEAIASSATISALCSRIDR